MDSDILSCTIFFSIVGMGYFAFGRKHNPYIKYAGFLLMIFPYFVSTFWWMIIIGFAIMALPYLLFFLTGE